MIRRLLQWLIHRTGRDTQIDPAIPASALASYLVTTAVALLRGLVRLRRLAFLGPSVEITGQRSLHIGPYARVGAGASVDCVSSAGVHLGPASQLGRGTVVTTTSHLSRLGVGFALGARSGLGDHCHVGASGGVRIGDDVIAGSYVSFHSQEHVYADPSTTIRSQGTTEVGIEIGNDCWIGAKATILDGTTIGSGSVIAAGAVVKGTFPAGSVLAGVPATVIRSRLTDGRGT